MQVQLQLADSKQAVVESTQSVKYANEFAFATANLCWKQSLTHDRPVKYVRPNTALALLSISIS